jgi:hypothetical protein
MECGHMDSFRRKVTETIYREIEEELNHDGEIIDTDELDEYGDDREEDEPECMECQSDNITWFESQAEIDNKRLKHTDEDGEWTEEEVEEEEWNKDLKNEIFNKRL